MTNETAGLLLFSVIVLSSILNLSLHCRKIIEQVDEIDLCNGEQMSPEAIREEDSRVQENLFATEVTQTDVIGRQALNRAVAGATVFASSFRCQRVIAIRRIYGR